MRKVNREKGISVGDSFVVIFGFILVLLISIISGVLPKLKLLEHQALVQEKFVFGGQFMDMASEAINIISPNNIGMLEELNKKLDPKLMTFISFYLHAKNTKEEVHLNLTKERQNTGELKEEIQKRLEENSRLSVPNDVKYKVVIPELPGLSEFGVRNRPEVKIKSIGNLRLPFPIPGENILFFKYERADTQAGIVLNGGEESE